MEKDERKSCALLIVGQPNALRVAKHESLARRMAQVGNFSKLRQAREQAFYADAALNLARAQQSAVSARGRLARVLGVVERSQIQLPNRLPDLPKDPNELGELKQLALDQRLNLQAIRLETEALAKNLGLTQATRFINVLEVGPARVLEGERNSGYNKGYEISFELPIFDWGGAKVAKAEAVYMQAVERAAEVATNARSEVPVLPMPFLYPLQWRVTEKQ